MRTMGLDVGDKTIGVAVSDELEITANPVTVIRRTPSIRKDVGEVCRIAEEQHIGKIVVGMPYMLDGTVGIQGRKVEAIVEALRRRTRIPVVVWDERYTTSEAEQTLIEMDTSRAKRRRVIDKLAAAVILQSYLDNARTMAGREGEADEAG